MQSEQALSAGISRPLPLSLYSIVDSGQVLHSLKRVNDPLIKRFAGKAGSHYSLLWLPLPVPACGQ